MSWFIYCYVECCYAKCRYADCHGALVILGDFTRWCKNIITDSIAICYLPVTSYQSPVARCQVPGARFQVPGSKFQVPGARCQAPVTRFQVSGARCQVLGVRCQVSGTRCHVPGGSRCHKYVFQHLCCWNLQKYNQNLIHECNEKNYCKLELHKNG